MLRQGEDQATEATMLQAQLRKIGLKVELDVLDYGSYTISTSPERSAVKRTVELAIGRRITLST